MKGRLIALEGLDGSGKATQTELLSEALIAQGKKVCKISFPDYQSLSSSLVKMYLGGEFGNKPEDVNAYAASSFYAVDRFASFKRDWGQFYNEGGIVLADRYTTSNAIHQCSKLPEEQWDAYLKWLFQYEYGLLGIPKPDVVIFLKTDVETSRRLVEKRYQEDGGKKDIHENNIQYLLRAQEAALYCAKKLEWDVIECLADGEMRGVDEIHRSILKAVSTHTELWKG